MSRKISYAGILLALNIVLLALTNIIPINTMFIMGLSSLPISILIIKFGAKYGSLFYISSSILSFFCINNKIHWIMYVFTFGIYGLIKYLIETRMYSQILEMIFKLLFANIIIMILYFILKNFIYIPVNIYTIAIFEIAFIAYDYAYSTFIDYYYEKFAKILK